MSRIFELDLTKEDEFRFIEHKAPVANTGHHHLILGPEPNVPLPDLGKETV